MNYYIFGAHSRGYTLFEYLRTLEPSEKTLGFLYDNEEDNPDVIEDVPVYHLLYDGSDIRYGINTDAQVYIAVRGEYHKGVMGRLQSFGFNKITVVDPVLDTLLRNRYVALKYKERGYDLIRISDPGCFPDKGPASSQSFSASVFIAKTISDKEFTTPVPLRSYEHIIQAGCALTEERLTEAEFFDDMNESELHGSISSLNRQFSELTALYSIRRNCKDDIIGLEHWRRRFILPEDLLQRMNSLNLDVILPVPLCVMPSLRDNYLFRHEKQVWSKTIEIMNDMYSGQGDAFEKYCAGNSLYSPCNMIIARRGILSEYCDWLFPILLRLNDEIGVLKNPYQNRYPGFISERLLTYYFDMKREDIKVAFADKNFLS